MTISLTNTVKAPSGFASTMNLPIEFMEDYSKEATIHGVKYFSERKRHWTEKTFWMTIFIISIALCVQNVMEIYDKRINKPVMISFAKGLSQTFEIPFPAVTICSENKATGDDIDLAEILKDEHRNFSSDELTKLKALYQVCDFRDHKDLNQILSSQSENSSDVVSTLNELTKPMSGMFDRCRYGSQKLLKCDQLFSKLITDEGVCYTFNMLDQSELFEDTIDDSLQLPIVGLKSQWFLDKDYASDKLKAYPHRVIGHGVKSGLAMELKIRKSELNPGCKRGVRGFRLSLHTPVELPQMSKQFFNVPFLKQTTLSVKPEMIYSSKDIKDYTPESRQCYFSQERNLEFFRVYSKANCELECLAKYILTTCGCVKFSMPHNNETKVCDHSELTCVEDAELKFITRDLERKLLSKQLKKDLKHGKIKEDDAGFEKLKQMKTCQCLPPCVSLRYDVEISQTDYLVDGDEDFLTASVNIYFKTAHFTRLKRYEIYGWTDFLSSTGGIFGLFLGCSVLSFIEIVYHLIAYCVKRVRKPKIDNDLPSPVTESSRI